MLSQGAGENYWRDQFLPLLICQSAQKLAHSSGLAAGKGVDNRDIIDSDVVLANFEDNKIITLQQPISKDLESWLQI